MRVNTGKGCSDYDPAEERRQIKKGQLPKPTPVKRIKRIRDWWGRCPNCGEKVGL